MASPLHQLDVMSTSEDFENKSGQIRIQRERSRYIIIKHYVTKAFQIIHFFIVAVYLWAGLVEFINNPPFFDAYGDAISENRLPEGIFQNDPRQTQWVVLRLMDLPILVMLLAYACLCIWLKFEGLAWLLTISLSIAFLCFWIVNFWAQPYFDWRYYSSRTSGLELQVSSIALSGTTILGVLFYKRKKMPFKFKSSLPVRILGPLHLIYNICCIYLIMFASLLMWFTKMYISWACFKNHSELLQICQITTQVQCYPCHICSPEGIKKCFKNETKLSQFTCNMQFPKAAKHGSFCIFNYNLSGVEFLTIFAYIGGLCVFLSTFIRLIGHYTLRIVFLLYEHTLRLCNKSSSTIQKHRENLRAVRALKEARRTSVDSPHLAGSSRELISPTNEGDIEHGRPYSSSQLSDTSDDDNANQYDFLNASCG